jgi:GTP-binding protein
VVGVDGREFIIADLPGLIEGAHEGHGLGDRFLGHLERCAVLLHLVDGTGEDVGLAYRTVRHEIEAYGAGLTDKPELVALNKCDALTEDEIGTRRKALELACGGEVMVLSGATGAGVQDCLRALLAAIDRNRVAERAGETVEEDWRP